ncbi:acyl carrier protein [Kitasatospora viridis]|uniref:Acyl carrier protein n=1 Tax=Kitasatospora viridis TaxID=281105 RepID=A0A561UC53_9ACTN|nr:acyl carrier protein [Kitasatospora viridis]TWF96947.1 acyl carrier protein [Kitasatospora viridis]
MEAIITTHHDAAATPVAAEPGAGEPVRAWLTAQLAALLGVAPEAVPFERPLGELGIDSLTAAEFSVEVEERTGVNVPLERFLGDLTLTGLIAELESGQVPA